MALDTGAHGEATRGMDPVPVLTLDIGGTKIAGAIVTFGGNKPTISLASSTPTRADRGGAQVLATIVDFAGSLLHDAARAGVTPAGIGVSSAGVIRAEDGSIASATDTMPGWASQPLGEALRQASGLPVAVLNDVHGHALGEVSYGAATGASTALVFAVGTGMGGAAVINGTVHHGARGVSGHFGHLFHPLAAGLICSCGRESHIESVASGSGLARLWAKRAAALAPESASIGAPWRAATYTGALEPVSETFVYQSAGGAAAEPLPTQVRGGGEVAPRAAARSSFATAVIHDSGVALGEVVASLANCLDPDVVVLSGSVVGAGPAWRQGLEAGFAETAMTPIASTPLVEGSLGGNAPLIGAGVHLLHSLSTQGGADASAQGGTDACSEASLGQP